MGKKVAIVAMGESRNDFIVGKLYKETAEQLKGAEIWTINYMAAVIRCDRMIGMAPLDDPEAIAAYPEGHHEFFRESQIPIYTTKHVEGYNTVLYPLEEISEMFGGFKYLNNSVAYSVALAIYEGAEEIMLFGCDFNYPDKTFAENGRACVEFWLGVAFARGIRITVGSTSTLLDQSTNRPLYGYHLIEGGTS